RFARQCIDAGKPCLVEKPFALSVRDAEGVARAAAERRVPVLAGHLLVYHPAVERLRALVQGGELGRLYYLYGLRVNLGQVRADENALWSFGPHDVSVALYLLGEPPQRVAAQGRSYLQRQVEDVVFLTMEFASGVLAHVQLSWLDPHKERKLTVVGAKKMVVFDDMEPREKLRIYDKGVDRPPEYGSYGESLSIREGDIFIPKIPNVEPLAAELGHFVRVARGAEAPRAGAEDGVRVGRGSEAASGARAGTFAATSDLSRLKEPDVISICVPTPLSKTKDPDVSYVLAATNSVKQTLRRGQLVVLESTTYPGTTRELMLPALESTGLKVGKDFFLAFSPERVDPGNPAWNTRNTPKVVGGITPECLRVAVAIYQPAIERLVAVSSTEAAELVKILENTFRSVNIGLVNEMAIVCDKLGVNVWEVIDAAATKPFGFMKFTPGPGLGGHCIPIDPHYL